MVPIVNPDRPGVDPVDVIGALDAVGQAVIITGVDGVVRFWNRAAEELYGWPAEEALGRPVLEVTSTVGGGDRTAAVLADLLAGRPWAGDAVLGRRDGSTFLARVRSTPVQRPDGEVIGVIGVSEDVTAEREEAEARNRNQQRLLLALEAGGLGVWEWDEAARSVRWDQAMERVFGVEPGSAPTTLDAYAQLLHPEDRDAVLEMVDRAMADGTPFTVEHRVVRSDGSVRWVQGDGRPVTSGDQVTGLIGVSADVTERREIEAERVRLLAEEASARRQLELAQNRLRFLADAAAAIAEPLELHERLARLARLCVPRFADASAVYLLDDSGQPRVIALHHREPELDAMLWDLIERYPERLDSPVGVGAAIREGRTEWVPTVPDELLEKNTRSPEHLAAARSLRINAGVAVPLVGPEGPFGAVAFITVDGRQMTRDDVVMAEELCGRIGISVYNGQLLEARERDREAQRYQAALLQSVLESSVDGVVAIDVDGNVLASNQRFLDIWGYDAALLRAGDDALMQAAAGQVLDGEGFVATVRRCYSSGTSEVDDEVFLRDGRVLDRHGRRIEDEDGNSLGFTWSFRDITTERAHQAEVAAAGERFATLARTLQQSLLPPSLPTPGGIELAARYHPAYQGIDVGGDFYDVFAVGDEWILVIGDVCGKGAEAATLTALARYTIRAAAIHHADPAATLAELNTAMLAHADTGPRRFATVCCIRLRASAGGVAADIACGGHPLPVILRSDGTIEAGGEVGTLLGVFETVHLTTRSVDLRPGDTVIAVTDGVLEARDESGRLLDQEGLDELVSPLAGRPADEIGSAIEKRALAVQNGVARDDIAVLVARILEPSKGARPAVPEWAG